MNRAVTTKEEILSVCRKIMIEKGIDALNMREVALGCGTAVGSIYNYFPSKADLISAAVESVWSEIFSPLRDVSDFDGFAECIERMYKIIKNGSDDFPGFFDMHPMNFSLREKKKGREVMKNYFALLEERFVLVLKNDKKVRKGAFDKDLTEEKFVGYVLYLLISSLIKRENSCRPLITMINNCIY